MGGIKIGKISVEDFYGWHPDTVMASESVYDAMKMEDTLIRLCSANDYCAEKLYYYVYVSYANFTYFDCLQDAIDYYNKKLEEYENLCS